MGYLYRSTALLLFIISSVFNVQAQEKTVAGLYNEGLALLKTKDYAGGLALMEQALEKAGPDDEKVVRLAKKNSAIAAYNLGNAARKAGTHDAAIEFYNKGIANNPTNSSNYEGIARAQEAKGAKVEAVKAYLEAAAKGEEEGKADKAASRQKKAQTMVGKLFVAKSYTDAIAVGEAFIAAKPGVAEVHYYVSRSYAETAGAEKAVEHAEQAVSLAAAPEDKFFYALASQLEALGKKAEAVASYEKITGEKYKKQADYKISQLKG